MGVCVCCLHAAQRDGHAGAGAVGVLGPGCGSNPTVRLGCVLHSPLSAHLSWRQYSTAAAAQEAAGVAACLRLLPARRRRFRHDHAPALHDCLLFCALCCACWCRMHVCIEDLLADSELISLLQDLLLLSDRAKLADLPALAASS